MFEIREWPYHLGPPDASGVIRTHPYDFEVEEIPRISPGGEGGHLWLWIEKTGANTDWVAARLAAVAGCLPRDVGYAGLKDRHAVTRQWFSLPATGNCPEDFENAAIKGVRILGHSRHTRKLKRGTLDGNRFSLMIREFKGDRDSLRQRLERVRESGVPNYFGPQRFGHLGRNVEKGFDLLSRNIRLKRNKRSIYLSAIRSFLFNMVLAERVEAGNWNRFIDGDLAMLDGTQSIFPYESGSEDIEDRCDRHDIHPTGPMPGEGGMQVTAEVAELERVVLQQWPQLMEILISQRVQASRRALRLCPAGLEWQFDEGGLKLSFTLPPGTYATTALREIIVFTDAAMKPDCQEQLSN